MSDLLARVAIHHADRQPPLVAKSATACATFMKTSNFPMSRAIESRATDTDHRVYRGKLARGITNDHRSLRLPLLKVIVLFDLEPKSRRVGWNDLAVHRHWRSGNSHNSVSGTPGSDASQNSAIGHSGIAIEKC